MRRAECYGVGGTLFAQNALCAFFVDASAWWVAGWTLCSALLYAGAAWCVVNARRSN